MEPLTHWILNASLRGYSRLVNAVSSISINLAPVNLHGKDFRRYSGCLVGLAGACLAGDAGNYGIRLDRKY